MGRALKTADQIQGARWKSAAQAAIADAQAKVGDIAGAKVTFALALKTSDLNQVPLQKSYTLCDIYKYQVDAGDVADARDTLMRALKSADSVQGGYFKDSFWRDIAGYQVKAGDITEAQQTTDLIQNAGLKSQAQAGIAEAQAKMAPTSNSAPSASPATVAQAPVRPAVPVITARDWLNKLDDKSTYSDCALNTDPFLNLAGYLKSLPPSDDPQKVFQGLRETAEKIVTAQNVIDQMLKQQAKK